MKIQKTASGKNTVKMSKKEWQDIGKKAGWMREAQSAKELAERIVSLFEEDPYHKRNQYFQDLPQMEEATPEDLEAGYGHAMSGDSFRTSLTEPMVDFEYENSEYGFETWQVYYYGNYPQSSVNAGQTRRVFVGEIESEQELNGLKTHLSKYKIKF